MSKSVNEIASELGISRQAVMKKLTPEFRRKHATKVAGKLQVDNAGVAILTGSGDNQLQPKSNQVQPNDNQLIDILHEQLNAKDEQLRTKDNQLKEKDDQINKLMKLNVNLTSILDQQQRLSLADKANDSKRIEQRTARDHREKRHHWWQLR